MGEPAPQLQRLVEVMARLRAECPWDAEQTHRSLVRHLIEETAEVVDAIEAGGDDDLREELGDLLMQVYFHAEIARTEGRFDIDEVAAGICDKLELRHPWVFADQPAPGDIRSSWEQAKRVEKRRRSALDGIPESLATLAAVQKVVARSRHLRVGIDLDDTPITADQVGQAILLLVQRAQASGVDADQATRDALRRLVEQIRAIETGQDS